MRLPDWVLCGAQRSGTTSLWNSLAQHPRIFVPETPKEINFFSHHYEAGLEWYGRFFEAAQDDQFCGEASPNYMIHSTRVAPRMKSLIPGARLIFTLRNPADRAYSCYQFDVGRGKYRGLHRVSFQHALSSAAGQKYLRDGEYARQLSDFRRLFPRSQILILLYEDLVRDPETTLNALWKFLGVEKLEIRVQRDNPARVLRRPGVSSFLWYLRKSGLLQRVPAGWRRFGRRAIYREGAYPPMGEETQTLLRDYYSRWNDLLAKATGLDLRGWD